MNKPIKMKRAFTLIELLTVISVITLLMAVLGISANKVRHVSQNLSQRAQIHSMEVGLELFAKDFGDYPSSTPIARGGSGFVYGAQHLTEALFGRDLAGIEENSRFHNQQIPHVDGWFQGQQLEDYYDPDSDVSKSRRKGPYMQFGKGGVSVVYMKGSPEMPAGGDTLYSDAQLGATNIYTATGDDYAERAPVITDIFRQKRVTLSGGENVYVGTPILYFKANRETDIFKPQKDSQTYPSAYGTYSGWTYDYHDNWGFYKLPNLQEPENIENTHRFDDTYTDAASSKSGVELFYDYITNKKIESYPAPQNSQGFIIISAGRDGVFGNDDDVANFER